MATDLFIKETLIFKDTLEMLLLHFFQKNMS